MKFQIGFLFLILIGFGCSKDEQVTRNEKLFDDNWKFHLGDIEEAYEPLFDDGSWRDIDLPHDWSIEKLPGQKAGEVVGPFSKESPGKTATGYTIGGTAWYRKTFTLEENELFTKTIINFDGVYMNCDVWVNGKSMGSHPYGYTAFQFDITDYLEPAGKPNVIAVRVKNEGKNSRWYSGSGIYRHVWLIQKQAVHIRHNGVFITTKSIADNKAEMNIKTSIYNFKSENPEAKLSIKIIDADGKTVQQTETPSHKLSSYSEDFEENITVTEPQLWSTESPNLYTAKIQVLADGVVTDEVSTTFGIRTIQFDAENGFLLNGENVLLKGGCMHHDNGFLGSATIDRAEERKVELMKKYGFNAIRVSHNPPSSQFLDACDRNGILVIDEAFDMWERPKNPEDYHLYFKEWWKSDIASMMLRDRNHPSVIMWSIGNEINERADSLGFVIRKKLVAEVKKWDTTRPVTEAICGFWDHPGQEWSTTAPAFAMLDVGGYNYRRDQYDADHAEFPDRIMVGTESYPGDSYDYWEHVKNDPWVIGDFVWTAMDYLGETGIGHTRYTDDPDRGLLRQWPWFNAHCGDIDLCGNKKPQLHYRDVVWENSRLEMAVHVPIPDGKREFVNYWGWPNELQSWNWSGQEGKEMDVRVFTSYPAVRLELNGKVIAEQELNEDSKYIATFKVAYEPGTLKAIALENGEAVAEKEFTTTGSPAKIKLTADRDNIIADRNDLSYVIVEITDAAGNVIPDAAIPVKFSVTGVGEIAGSGNACPYDMESFNNPECKTYKGQAHVILRPLKETKTGTITLKVEAEGLETGELGVTVE